VLNNSFSLSVFNKIIIGLLFVSHSIIGCTNKANNRQQALVVIPRTSPFQLGLFINQDCNGFNCTDTIIPIKGKGNELSLKCKYISPQIMNVMIQWVYGSNIQNMDCYLVCWQSSEICRIQDTVATKKIDNQSPQSFLSFDNLNMSKFDYTVALRIGEITSVNFSNYPVSVYIPKIKAAEVRTIKTWKSKNPTCITPFDFTDDTFRCTYEVPNGNSPKYTDNYIVLFKGGMSANFDKMNVDDFSALKKVNKSSGGEQVNTDLLLTKELKHQKLYTIAYLMANTGDTIPNLNGLVAWKEFITN
jgi:hypothetical protein